MTVHITEKEEPILILGIRKINKNTVSYFHEISPENVLQNQHNFCH